MVRKSHINLVLLAQYHGHNIGMGSSRSDEKSPALNLLLRR